MNMKVFCSFKEAVTDLNRQNLKHNAASFVVFSLLQTVLVFMYFPTIDSAFSRYHLYKSMHS